MATKKVKAEPRAEVKTEAAVRAKVLSGIETLQKQAEQDLANGYTGVKVDTAPNSAYTGPADRRSAT